LRLERVQALCFLGQPCPKSAREDTHFHKVFPTNKHTSRTSVSSVTMGDRRSTTRANG
jgi:hypothetical protein